MPYQHTYAYALKKIGLLIGQYQHTYYKYTKFFPFIHNLIAKNKTEF